VDKEALGKLPGYLKYEVSGNRVMFYYQDGYHYSMTFAIEGDRLDLTYPRDTISLKRVSDDSYFCTAPDAGQYESPSSY
jgi:hypothetical protein